jgi:hypothetical protein
MTKSLLLMMELGIPWLNTGLVHMLPSHPSLLGVTHAASEFVQDHFGSTTFKVNNFVSPCKF